MVSFEDTGQYSCLCGQGLFSIRGEDGKLHTKVSFKTDDRIAVTECPSCGRPVTRLNFRYVSGARVDLPLERTDGDV